MLAPHYIATESYTNAAKNHMNGTAIRQGTKTVHYSKVLVRYVSLINILMTYPIHLLL